MAKQNQKVTRCYYPECQLCCKEDGYQCGVVETHKPRTELLLAITNGILLTVALILLVAFILYVWPQ
jgi:hypothetical protein